MPADHLRILANLHVEGVEFIIVGGICYRRAPENLARLELSGVGGYDALVPEAEAMDIGGHRTMIIGLDQLIRAKRAAGRGKDLIHVQEFQEIRRRR